MCAVGVVMVLGGGDSEGTAFAEPAALAGWDLKLDAPLKAPQRAPREHLPAILTGVVKNALPWATSWLSQILSGAAWLQVAPLSGFKRGVAMRALHKAVQKAYCSTPHSVPATIKILHHLSYHMPAKRCVVAARVA